MYGEATRFTGVITLLYTTISLYYTTYIELLQNTSEYSVNIVQYVIYISVKKKRQRQSGNGFLSYLNKSSQQVWG